MFGLEHLVERGITKVVITMEPEQLVTVDVSLFAQGGPEEGDTRRFVVMELLQEGQDPTGLDSTGYCPSGGTGTAAAATDGSPDAA